jgi:hypothetical protein
MSSGERGGQRIWPSAVRLLIRETGHRGMSLGIEMLGAQFFLEDYVVPTRKLRQRVIFYQVQVQVTVCCISRPYITRMLLCARRLWCC